MTIIGRKKFLVRWKEARLGRWNSGGGGNMNEHRGGEEGGISNSLFFPPVSMTIGPMQEQVEEVAKCAMRGIISPLPGGGQFNSFPPVSKGRASSK
jgi:hypothetical protein